MAPRKYPRTRQCRDACRRSPFVGVRCRNAPTKSRPAPLLGRVTLISTIMGVAFAVNPRRARRPRSGPRSLPRGALAGAFPSSAISRNATVSAFRSRCPKPRGRPTNRFPSRRHPCTRRPSSSPMLRLTMLRESHSRGSPKSYPKRSRGRLREGKPVFSLGRSIASVWVDNVDAVIRTACS
jgi:hypothetical protein